MIALLLAAAVVPIDSEPWQVTDGPARAGLAAAVWNGRLYVAGGSSPSGNSTDVLFAPLSPTGAPGALTSTTPLRAPRAEFGMAALSGRLYVAGGGTAEVDFASIGADGSVGSFAATRPLPQAVSGAGFIAADGRLYAVGGMRMTSTPPATYFADVFVGTPDPITGQVSWAAGTPLPAGRSRLGVIASAGSLYVVGGEIDDGANGAASKDVLTATLDAQGIPGPWTQLAPLPGGRRLAAVFESGGFIFVAGGQDSGHTYRNYVMQVRILPDRSLGFWTSGSALPRERWLHAAAVADGRAYVVGGRIIGGYASDLDWRRLRTPGPAAALALSGPTAATVGDCFGPFIVQLLDTSGKVTWPDAPIVLNVASQPHYDEMYCNHASPDTSIPVVAGLDSAMFYLHATAAGTMSVTASGPGLTSAAPIDVSVHPPPDPHLVNGWGCSTSGPAMGWLALLVLLYSSRRATAGSRREARQAG
jgi:hypothetical protein